LSAYVKNAWSYTSALKYVLKEWHLVKHRSSLTFLPFVRHKVAGITTYILKYIFTVIGEISAVDKAENLLNDQSLCFCFIEAI